MINPNKYIRKGLIDLIAPATGLPVYDVSIPLDEILPNQYVLLHSQTKRKTAQSKWCYEWMCSINIDVFSINKKGFVSSAKNDDIEGLILTAMNSFKLGNFSVKDVNLIDSVPSVVEMPDHTINRTVLIYEIWVDAR